MIYGPARRDGHQMRAVAVPLLVVAVLAFAQDGPQVLDLSGWVQLGLQRAPSLAQSEASLLAADASVRTSSSFLWPSLSFRSSAGHSWSSIPDGSGGYTDTDNSSWSMSMNLSQEILGSGGRDWLLLAGSRHARTASEMDYDKAELDLMLSIAEGYYGVIEATEQLNSARRALIRSSEQFNRTRSLYELGGVTNLEMIQAEVQVSRDSLTVLQRRQGVTSSYASLRSAVGVVSSHILVDTAAVLPPISMRTVEGFLIDFSANPSLLAAEERLEEVRLSHEARQRSYWPSLSAGGSWSWSNDELEFDDFADRDSWNVSMTLNWQLFDGFSREGLIQSSRSSVLRQEATIESLENSLYTSALMYRDNLISSIAAWDLSERVTEQAIEQLRLSEMSYDLGGTSLLDLLAAQSTLADAEASEASALSACLIAEARFLVVLGQSPRLGE